MIVSYFHSHAAPVLTRIFLQFGATICLGLFCAVTVSRLHFLGVNAAGPYNRSARRIPDSFLVDLGSSLAVWTMIHPAVVQTPSVSRDLFG